MFAGLVYSKYRGNTLFSVFIRKYSTKCDVQAHCGLTVWWVFDGNLEECTKYISEQPELDRII